MNTTSMQEKVIFNMFKPRMKKLENNWKNSQEKLPWKRLNFRSKLLEQNSTSLQRTYIISQVLGPYQACTIHHIHKLNLRHLMSI